MPQHRKEPIFSGEGRPGVPLGKLLAIVVEDVPSASELRPRLVDLFAEALAGQALVIDVSEPLQLGILRRDIRENIGREEALDRRVLENVQVTPRAPTRRMILTRPLRRLFRVLFSGHILQKLRLWAE